MRWTYTFFTLIHLSTATQLIAYPTHHTDAVGHPNSVQLAPRELLPTTTHSKAKAHSASRRSTRTRKQTRPGKPAPAAKAKANLHQKAILYGMVKAKSLKSHNYRKQTIGIANLRGKQDWSNHDADHILEVQMVAKYMNAHRKGKVIGHKCRKAVKGHLNHPSNLEMLEKSHNQAKAVVVHKIMHGDNKAKFSSTVKNHIMSSKNHIENTVKKIDREFHPNGACSEIATPGKGGGVHGEAKKMIAGAQRS